VVKHPSVQVFWPSRKDMACFDLDLARLGNQSGGRGFIGRKEERPATHIGPSDQETPHVRPMRLTVWWVTVKGCRNVSPRTVCAERGYRIIRGLPDGLC
jgi:hypothetical protein